MFLNKTMLKKLIKSSFKWEGLKVGRIYGGLVVTGGRWSIWTQDGYIPNWLKAAVMEYTGELPEQECMFKAKKDEPIQYEIADDNFHNLPDMRTRCRYSYTVTPVTLCSPGNGSVRILQQIQTGRMLFAPAVYIDILDLSELGDENAPSGPASVTSGGEILLYKNGPSAFAFMSLDAAPNDMYGRIATCIGEINFSKQEE